MSSNILRRAVLCCLTGFLAAPVNTPVMAQNCDEYADQAVGLYRLTRRYPCGFIGPQWSDNRSGHYSWCRGAQYQTVLRESNFRRQLAAACLKAKTDCDAYAEVAVAQDWGNKNYRADSPIIGSGTDRAKCAESNTAIWHGDRASHKSWCLGVSAALRENSLIARSKALMGGECPSEADIAAGPSNADTAPPTLGKRKRPKADTAPPADTAGHTLGKRKRPKDVIVAGRTLEKTRSGAGAETSAAGAEGARAQARAGVNPAIYDQYVGNYLGVGTVSREGNRLYVVWDYKWELVPQSETVFWLQSTETTDRSPTIIRFNKSSEGRVVSLSTMSPNGGENLYWREGHQPLPKNPF